MRQNRGRRRGPGEGTIVKRTDGRWMIQVEAGYENGKRIRATAYARSQKEAVEKRREMQARLRAGRPPLDSASTLAKFTTWWLTDVVDVSSRADSTKSSYRAEAERSILPALGHHRLSALRPQHIAAWMATMDRQAKEHPTGIPSDNTRRIRLAVLRGCLTSAVDLGLLHENPAARIKPPRPERDESRVRNLTSDEVKALLEAAEGHRLHALWLILLLMGLRKGEALALRWADLDLVDGFMSIERSLGRVKGKGLVVTTPKTPASVRRCPLPPMVADALHPHFIAQEIERAEHGAWSDDDLVFTTATGRPIEPAGLNRQYAALCRRAGIEPGPLHNLRHTAATLLRQHGGADLLDLSRMLGHSSVRITGDMYGHVVTDVQRGIVNRMSEALSSPDTRSARQP